MMPQVKKSVENLVKTKNDLHSVPSVPCIAVPAGDRRQLAPKFPNLEKIEFGNLEKFSGR